jgi:hypothetical protein
MRRRRIGYAKLGRSMPLRLDKCGSNGGDVEMLPTLKLLAERHPDVDFVIVGRNSGDRPSDVGLPDNVTNPWIAWKPQIRRELKFHNLVYSNLSIDDHIKVRDILRQMTGHTIQTLDGIVMWVGQHGTSNTPLPSIEDRSKLTKPYDWATLYGSYLLGGINAWRDVDPHTREEVLLNADPRNVPKYRDCRYPWQHPILSQYDQTNVIKHEEGDRVVSSMFRSVYSRLEISGLIPGTPFGDTVKFNYNHDRPHDFGIVFNETKREVSTFKSRRHILTEWVLPLGPGFVRGKWTDATLKQLEMQITPVDVLDYFELLQSARCTLTTPSSGSGWATAKPWEAFAAGVVCFFHPAYDDQNHILSDAPEWLRDWLRVSGPKELRDKVRAMCDMPKFWLEVVEAQRHHFWRAVTDLRYLKMIEERLGL